MGDRPTATIVVRSALDQTRPDIEVIVVDDDSRPAFVPETDQRIRVVRRDRSNGVCAARNAGLQAARGEWIAFLDDDDEVLPRFVESALQAALESTLPAPISVLAAIEVSDEAGAAVEVRRPPTLPLGADYHMESCPGSSFQVHNTLLVRTALLRSLGGWDEALRSWEHDDLFLRLNRVSSFQGLDEVTYRLTSAAADRPRLSADLLARAQSMDRTVRKHRQTFARHRRYKAKYLGTMGVTYLRAGRWAPAIRATTLALAADPRRRRGLIQWVEALAGPRARRLAVARSPRRRHPV